MTTGAHVAAELVIKKSFIFCFYLLGGEGAWVWRYLRTFAQPKVLKRGLGQRPIQAVQGAALVVVWGRNPALLMTVLRAWWRQLVIKKAGHENHARLRRCYESQSRRILNRHLLAQRAVSQ